jgi:short subunit dehydrogenase-like uncharacterized protein
VSTPDREHDVVVFGATGFVGKLTAQYLAGAAPEGARIALGGRSPDKLARVKEELGVDWPVVVADSSDRPALDALAASTRAVATTVGPYMKYGVPLVEACAAAGTHYADLTGETHFMRRSIDVAHGPAQASGARIVHTCGFDSIPSDLSVLLLHEAADEPLTDTTLVVRAMRGGASGGTIDSMRGVLDAAKGDKATAVMLGEAALALALDALPDAAGVLTPATAMGNVLVERLRAAGHTYEVR